MLIKVLSSQHYTAFLGVLGLHHSHVDYKPNVHLSVSRHILEGYYMKKGVTVRYFSFLLLAFGWSVTPLDVKYCDRLVGQDVLYVLFRSSQVSWDFQGNTNNLFRSTHIAPFREQYLVKINIFLISLKGKH
jgi:hypothetical protein